ncbi:diamine N-acetyltransferase [Allocatelliglobosispora scoriae]|uniref:Diamine N-acetyltransferase n=1 Tax=Allocatelliglobosispora scoriae TaxID=643052 RepID=A0A841BJ21_9ACTN|nr:GNAT family N-acetyltransferase [Allocatelliglobosispora scoriae]MBB5867196.1 diamine N-acetyltransferase [Allocatelliglobosispora scoriae]
MRLELVTKDNVHKVCKVKVHPHQEVFVAPVAKSLAEAYVYPDAAWPRAIVDGDRIVGFVMVAIQPDDPIEAYRFCLWRLIIDADEQGKGYGRFAVQAVAEEGRRRGIGQLHSTWHPGDGGPEEFYVRLGFVLTGEVLDDETVGVLQL